jgi:alkylated DNA nucleotide flippase Atl1
VLVRTNFPRIVPWLRYIRRNSTSRAPASSAAQAVKGVALMPEGYCVKERKKVEIKDAKQVTMKNGRPAIQGTCPDCGTKIFKIGKLE